MINLSDTARIRLDSLCVEWGLPQQEMIELALREMYTPAEKHLEEALLAQLAGNVEAAHTGIKYALGSRGGRG